MVAALKHQGPTIQPRYQISDITYADDGNILTGGPEALPNLKYKAAK